MVRNLREQIIRMIKEEKGESQALKGLILAAVAAVGFFVMTSPDSITNRIKIVTSKPKYNNDLRDAYFDVMALAQQAEERADAVAERGTAEWYRAYNEALGQIMMQNQHVLQHYANQIVNTFTVEGMQRLLTNDNDETLFDNDDRDGEDLWEDSRSGYEDETTRED